MGLLSLFKSNSGVIENEKLAEDFKFILTSSEEIEVGFKLKDDTFVFTNKRLIVVEITKGKNSSAEYLSLPYIHISTFSVKSKKSFDTDATLNIWIGGQEKAMVEKEFNKSIDVYTVQRILAGHVLGVTNAE